MIGAAQATLVSGNQPWTPADATVALWLDASDSSTVIRSDGIITAWNDKSGNSKHALPNSSPPTYTLSGLNGRNVITFNKANSQAFFNDPGLTSGGYGGAVNAYWVAKRTNAYGGAFFAERLNGCNRVFQVSSIGDNRYVATDSYTVNYWLSNSNDFLITASAFIGSQNQKQNVGCSLWWNGSSIGLYNGGGALKAPIDGAPGYCVGGRGYISDFWDGFIAELIVELVDAETSRRQKFEGYLAHKWGLSASLPSDHPYRYKRP